MNTIPEKIHVAYGLISKTNQLAASLCSLFENTRSWVAIHIAHTSALPESEKKRIFDLVRRYGQEVYFYKIEDFFSKRMKNIMRKAGRRPAYQLGRYYIYNDYHPYRVLLGKILPKEVHKVINLDADTIVNMDIRRFWEHSLDGALFGACPDYGVQCLDDIAERCIPVINGRVRRDRYFNAGIFLFDLEKIRKVKSFAENIMQHTVDHYDEYAWIDQDAMNNMYGKSYKLLPEDFNYFVVKARKNRERDVKPVVYHYADNQTTLQKNDPFDLLYWKYFIKSGWMEEKKFLTFMDTMISDYISNIAQGVKLISSREFKIYFGKKEYHEFVMEGAFQQNKDCYFLTNEEETKLLDLKELLNNIEIRGKENCMVIILSDAYPIIAKYLNRFNLRENVDFFNGIPFVGKLKDLSVGKFYVDFI